MKCVKPYIQSSQLFNTQTFLPVLFNVNCIRNFNAERNGNCRIFKISQCNISKERLLCPYVTLD